MSLALGRYLADQDVAGVDFRADVHDARLIEVGQGVLTHVGDVRGDFLRPELGIAGDTGQFLNVDGGEAIFLDHALGNENGILEVVTVPGHKRDAHILTQRQLAHVDGRPVGENIAARHRVTTTHDGPLIDAGVLVGTHVLGQVVNIHRRFAGAYFRVVDAHDNAAGIHGVDDARAPGHRADAGIGGYKALHAGADQRLFAAQRRHRLTLHVGAHKRAVGIVVLQKRNQGRRHGHHLLRRYIHVIDAFRWHHREFVQVAHGDQVIDKLIVVIQGGGGLSDHVFRFVDGRQILDVVGHHAIDNLAVGTFKEAIGVGSSVNRQ